MENNGKFEARASSGSITLKQQNINSSVVINTSSGNITLQAQAINGHLLARMSSGRIASDFPLNNRIQGKEAKKRVDSVLGNNGPDIKLQTNSGDISLQRN